MKTAEDSVDAAAASAELTQKKPVAEAKVTTAAANSKRESAVKAMLVIEPTVTPFEIDTEFSSEDAMDLAAEAQEGPGLGSAESDLGSALVARSSRVGAGPGILQ